MKQHNWYLKKHSEIPLHTGEHGHHKQINKQQVLERLWTKGNHSALLVGLQTGTALWNFLIKLKMELPFDPELLLLGIYPKNPESPIQKNLCSPMCKAAQFIIAKCWKQSKCPSANEWIKKTGTFTQWNTMQQKERRSTYPWQQHGWIWRALC